MNLFSEKKTFSLLVFIFLIGLILFFFYFIGLKEFKFISTPSDSENKNNATQKSQPTVVSGEENLTKELAGNIIGEIAKINSSSENSDSNKGVKVPTPEIIDKLTAETIDNFNPESFKPLIKDEDIRIISDNSLNSLSNYFKNFYSLLKKSSTSLASIDSKNELQALDNMIDIYRQLIISFYNLEAPQSITHFHKEEIALLSAKLSILEKEKAYSDDPLLAILAIKSDTYFDDQFTILKNSINDFLNKNRISFIN